MSAVSLPLWVVFAVSFGSPLLSFAGGMFAPWLSRLSAHEVETRSRREETLRTLRWAAELATSDDVGRTKLGIAQLEALGASDMLDIDQALFVDAALEAVYGGAIQHPEPVLDADYDGE